MPDSNYIRLAMRTDNDYGPDVVKRITNRDFMRLLHCSMGLCTEAGEFMDILKRHLFYGTPIDFTHIREEFGDAMWYMSLGFDVLVDKIEGMTTDTIFASTQRMNIAKLQARYPQKFTAHCAINRDLVKEREVLENHR